MSSTAPEGDFRDSSTFSTKLMMDESSSPSGATNYQSVDDRSGATTTASPLERHLQVKDHHSADRAEESSSDESPRSSSSSSSSFTTPDGSICRCLRRPSRRRKNRNRNEFFSLFNIAAPTAVVQFNVFFVYTLTASFVGTNLPSVELAAFSLASLTGNMTCLSVIVGVLTAAETQLPRAYGRGDHESVGVIAVRGYLAGCIVLAPLVVPLLTSARTIFVTLGQDPEPSELAAEWIRIYLIGVPAVLLWRVLQRFLACQGVVMPLVYASVAGTFVVHPTLLKILIPRFGFDGSAVAVVATQVLTVVMGLGYVRFKGAGRSSRSRVYTRETWPGLRRVWREAVRCGELCRFLRLGVGGVLALTEWWFWETVCFIAGRFGVIPLCVHTVAYQLIPLTAMVPLGIGIGLTVRMGSMLAVAASSSSASEAKGGTDRGSARAGVAAVKRLVAWTLLFSLSLAATASVVIYFSEDWIVGMFTRDEEVKMVCKEIWGNVSIYVTLLTFYHLNGAVLNALGLQLRKGLTVVGCLWCVALPVLWSRAVVGGGGLVAVWTVLPVVYAAMNVALVSCYAFTDWGEIGDAMMVASRDAERAKKRGASTGSSVVDVGMGQFDTVDESTGLLVNGEIPA